MAALILFIAAAIASWAAWIVWKHRQAIGGKVLFWMMAAIQVWTIAAAAEAATSDLSTKIIWSKIEYAGSVSAGPLLLIFALIYTHRNHLLTLRNLILLSTGPVFIFLLASTNEFHHLIWRDFIRQEYLGEVLYVYVHGPMFWIHVVFAFASVGAAIILLLQEYLRSTPVYRKQYSAFILAALVPLMGGLLYVLNWNPVPGLDITALSFAATGVFIAYGVQAYGLLDLVPIARHTVVEILEDGMIVIDLRNRIVDVNQAVLNMFNFTKPPLGEDVFMTFQNHPMLAATLLQKPSTPMEISLPGKPERHIDVRLTEILDGKGQTEGHIVILRDISDRKQIEAALEEKSRQMERMTITDDLTGLFNRRYIDQTIEREFRRAERQNINLAVALFDIDDFKQVNDGFGHPCGDEALRSVAKAINANIRSTDIAARMGGDEFLIIFPQTSRDDAWHIMERLRQYLSEVEYVCGHLSLSISGGVIDWAKGDSAVETIRRVDHLLYEAKRQGKNRFVKQL